MDKNFSCASRIRKLRTERGLSQEKLALSAGITPAYLGLLERGQRNATVMIIEKICGAMRISLADFFAEANNTEPLETDVGTQILHQISDLSSAEQESILQIVKDVIGMRHQALNGRK